MPSTHRYTLPCAAGAAREVAVARLWQAGALGVWERADDVVAYYPHQVEQVPPGGVWALEPERDWLAEFKGSLAPVTVGRFTIVPSWLPVPPGTDLAIVLDPEQAFGTGQHATTRMCLRALQEHDVRGARVLDVGTGSGILAIAAGLLGAGMVVAVDTDPIAVATAAANAARNGVAADVRSGSVELIGAATFDVVLANLVTDTVLAVMAQLVAVVAPRGRLILSGISMERAHEVVAALAAAGLHGARVSEEGEWAAVVAHRP